MDYEVVWQEMEQDTCFITHGAGFEVSANNNSAGKVPVQSDAIIAYRERDVCQSEC